MAYSSLIQLSQNIAVIPGPTNIGVIQAKNEGSLYLIDCGNTAKNAQHIEKLLKETFPKNTIKAVICTHSHADHAGGAQWFSSQCNAEIWTSRGEKNCIEQPVIAPTLFSGTLPSKEFLTEYFLATPTKVDRIVSPKNSIFLTKDIELSFTSLKGHCFDMIGIQCNDKKNDCSAIFLGDSIFGIQTLEKHPIPYTFDTEAQKQTLEDIKAFDCDFYVPSHGTIVTSKLEINRLTKLNLTELLKIEKYILRLCLIPVDFETILAKTSAHYKIRMKFCQHTLVGSTIKSFLHNLYKKGQIGYTIENYRMYWHTI